MLTQQASFQRRGGEGNASSLVPNRPKIIPISRRALSPLPLLIGRAHAFSRVRPPLASTSFLSFPLIGCYAPLAPLYPAGPLRSVPFSTAKSGSSHFSGKSSAHFWPGPPAVETSELVKYSDCSEASFSGHQGMEGEEGEKLCLERGKKLDGCPACSVPCPS